METRTRFAARAVVIDDLGRTLLFRARMPGADESARIFWITPGGGIEEGEDEITAVRREVFEETGLVDFAVGPPVWTRDHTFRWGDGMLRQVEVYYLIRVAAFEVSIEHHQQEELTFLTAHRWFSLDEIREHQERFVPANFADLLEPLLAGLTPESPIAVGI